MRIIPYLLYLYLIGLYVVIGRDLTTVWEVAPGLPVVLVLLVALYKEDIPATWFGFAAGLVAAAGGPPQMLGWYALAMAALALTGCSVRERLNLDSLRARLLMVSGGVLTYNIFVLALSGSDGLVLQLWLSALGGAIYAGVVAWFFFLFKDGKITKNKIQAMF